MNLNQQQKEAIEYYGSPQIIIAGAGTGKTTVMIEKINHLITTKKHQPHEILALTFTNKAANEMKERFHAKNNQSSQPYFGTFHSFCVRFLKQSTAIESVGLTKAFTIIDPSQQKDIIQTIMKSTQLSMERKPKEVLSKISSIKQHPQNMHAECLSDCDEDIQKLFKPYNQHLKNINSVDFDDLLLHAHFILNTNADELRRYQEKYQYIIIDEYQDTNQIQNDLSLLLAKQHENICVVGDFDQTIYSWRGAKVENLLQFNQNFPNTHTLKLEINYRSTTEILAAANQLIDFNLNRLPKKLITDRSSGNKIQHMVCFDEKEEANMIAEKIKKLQQSSEISYKDCAILYRTNQQSRAIEEALTNHNIPHHIIGTTAFYQRVEVKHAIAYLQCLHNINQPVWFERALLNPARGIGKTSTQAFLNYCIDTNQSITEAISNADCPLQERFKTIISTFINTITEIRNQTGTIQEKLTQLLDTVEFNTFLRKFENFADREANIKELMSRCGDIQSLEDFLEEITLFQGSDSIDEIDKVNCLTLHLAKGLEYKVVFIPGFEDALLPLKHCESVEEERRLAYVGITRGKEQVYLFSTYKRSMIGDDWYHNVSTFTKELNGQISISISDQTYHLGKAICFKFDEANLDYKVIKQKRTIHPNIKAAEIAFTKFEVGDVVIHPKLGTGVVQSANGDGDSLMYHINFPSGKKTLMAKFAPLTKAT